MDENVNPGYESIQVNFKIESDAPKETLQELVELAKKILACLQYSYEAYSS